MVNKSKFNKSTIEEGNKLIFELIYGEDCVKKMFEENSVAGPDFWSKACALNNDYTEMRYHDSWDRLIDVIDHIDKLCEETENSGIAIFKDHIEISYSIFCIHYDIEEDETRLDMAWRGLVDFIKKYNNKEYE